MIPLFFRYWLKKSFKLPGILRCRLFIILSSRKSSVWSSSTYDQWSIGRIFIACLFISSWIIFHRKLWLILLMKWSINSFNRQQIPICGFLLLLEKENVDLFYRMIELLRSIYLQQVKRDEIQSGSSSASAMCQSIVQQLGNTT